MRVGVEWRRGETHNPYAVEPMPKRMSAVKTEVTLRLDLAGREASVLERLPDAHAAVKELRRIAGRVCRAVIEGCCLHTGLNAALDMDVVSRREVEYNYNVIELLSASHSADVDCACTSDNNIAESRTTVSLFRQKYNVMQSMNDMSDEGWNDASSVRGDVHDEKCDDERTAAEPRKQY